LYLEINEINIGKDFVLIKRLGHGAFGEIFLATDLMSNIDYAIKIEFANS